MNIGLSRSCSTGTKQIPMSNPTLEELYGRIRRLEQERGQACYDRDAARSVVAHWEHQAQEAQRLLRVALGLLRVANFETDFEGRRCLDLERQIEAMLE